MRLFWDVEPLIQHGGEAPGYRVTFNGTPLYYAIWVNEETGEAEILCQDYRTGELIPDAANPYGYQTQRIKGTLKVACNQANAGEDTYPVTTSNFDALQMDFYQQLFGIP